ncbi:hypothetical protein M8J76_012345 [Diaphorina citri]|nr:hypothetical protein M8J76_012345 [Diaphorina citri]
MLGPQKSVRQRIGTSKSKSTNDIIYSSKLSAGSSSKKSNNDSLLAPTYIFAILIALFLLIYGFVMLIEKQLPQPLLVKNEAKYPGRFIAERAYNHLVNLTSLGPRAVGSFENEVLTVNLLRKEINNIIQRADPKVHQIRLDTQTVSGAFPLTFLDGMTNVYRNVQNVIVRIGPVVESAHSLLVNCHYDTVPDRASDDGSSCALMLEILRVVSLSPSPLQNNIVFLFNGAEEAFLQASHGFITQHRWARNVRAFVNLEACGAGGREVLFQSGPRNPWLMEVYSRSVPHPFASSLAQDVFQSGLIPGDTDFRIFRDFGNIPGLDFAWNKNGYVYHTRLDTTAQIPLATLQRTGDNILPLLLNLVNSKQLIAVHEYSEGSLIYFDFVGIFFVCITSTNTVLLCLTTLSIVLVGVYINAGSVRDALKTGYGRVLIRVIAFIIVNYLLCLLVNLAIAFAVTKVNRAMAWYGSHIWLLFLYVIPTLVTSCVNILYFSHRYLSGFLLSRRSNTGANNFVYYKLLSDGTLVFYSGVTVLLMLTYIGSVMIPVMWLFSLSIFTVLREKTRLRANAPGILLNFFLFTTVPFLLCSYLIYCVYLLIIPIMGRSGSGNHAEEVVAFITTTIFSLLFYLLAPLILYVRSPKKVLSLLSTGFLISVLLLVLTPLGFPYSGEISSPTPQRYMVMHVDRVYFSKENTVRERKSGLWLIDLDVNSPKTIENLLGDGLRLVNEETECSRELYCGLPYYLPVYSFIFQTHWIEDRTYTPLDVPLDLKLTYKHVEYSDGKKRTSDGRKPYSDEKTDADANNPSVGRERNATTAETESLNDEKADATRHSPARNATKGTTIKLSFALNGTDHVNIIASPYPGVELVRWSFLDGPPLKSKSQFRGRDTYYVFSTCASNLQTYHFWMEFFVPEKASVDFVKAFDSVGGSKGGQADDRTYAGDIVDMAVAAHHVHGEKQLTKPLAAFFNKLPEWTVSTGWRAGLHLYTF